MILEVIINLLSFNIGYFIGLIVNNPFWVFAFICAGYFFGEGKKLLWNFLIICGLVFVITDLLKAHELIFYTATALAILYMARMTVLMFLESTEKGKKMLPLGYSLVTYTVLLIYNLFMV